MKVSEICLLYSQWEHLTVHKDCWQNLAKLVAERRVEHADHT